MTKLLIRMNSQCVLQLQGLDVGGQLRHTRVHKSETLSAACKTSCSAAIDRTGVGNISKCPEGKTTQMSGHRTGLPEEAPKPTLLIPRWGLQSDYFIFQMQMAPA